ncbi:hypothetical protein [Neobacillus niacini]|jgi:hypothetical protein|uniref:hypothetical protein n=1 Tax=Neobacillus niacini TaxID=86668 RepID=UPI001C8D76C1|nr:hypothetical protein [Neobacillus niacini]MBY0148111.1 hypothetical protein [Neobacillus niacini]
MKKVGANEIQRGQAISFRIPSDTPDHLVKQLQKLKETERRNFSSRIAEFVMEGVSSVNAREREMITVPLPKKLTKAQRDWLKHEHSEALLGSIIYQLISDPVRSTSLLASLNSRSTDIDEALYLQEDIAPEIPSFENESSVVEEMAATIDLSDMNDDLNEFDWEKAKPVETEEVVEEEPDLDDLLGGFLASMNK